MPKVILLVEDSAEDEALTLGAFRENHVANSIVVARDGAEALDYVFGIGRYHGRQVSDLPQVVLLNLHLPKVDGLEVLRRIRADERTRRLPVVLLSWSQDKEDVARAYELGANSYLHKPVLFNNFAVAAKPLGLSWLLLREAPGDK